MNYFQLFHDEYLINDKILNLEIINFPFTRWQPVNKKFRGLYEILDM